MLRSVLRGALALLLVASRRIVVAQDCFATRAELRIAVNVFLSDPTDTFLSTTYGLPIGSWCVGAVTDFSGLFANARTFNEPLGEWDVAAARTLATMFQGAAAFDQDLSAWNTSSVVSLAGTFQGAESFNQPLTTWDTSSVTSLEATFQGARAFNQPLDGWDTSAVTNMADVFSFCTVFNQPLGHFNVSQVRSLNGAFSFAEEFVGEGLASWDTRKVVDMSDLFWNAVNFNGDVSGWQTDAVLNLHGTFADAHVFNQALPWNVASVIDLRYVRFGCDGV
jgi:surface protein